MQKLPQSDSRIPATIDTVGISFPVDDFNVDGCTATIQGLNTPDEAVRYNRKLPGGGFLATGIAGKGWVEASLPKRQDPDDPSNNDAVQLGEAVELLNGLYREALNYCDLSAGHVFEDSNIVRLDLVRDFHDVDRQTELLDGLGSIDQPGRLKTRRFADPSANRAETLRVGPKAWGCTLYDKFVESNGTAPEGQLRFEARLHRDQLRSAFAKDHGGHFSTVADLGRGSGSSDIAEVYWFGGSAVNRRRSIDRSGDAGSALARAQRAWFDRVGFDREVSATNELQRTLRASDLSASQQAALWAYLTLPGWAADASPNTRAKYRRTADELGLAPSFEHLAPTVTLRLDYDSATLVAA